MQEAGGGGEKTREEGQHNNNNNHNKHLNDAFSFISVFVNGGELYLETRAPKEAPANIKAVLSRETPALVLQCTSHLFGFRLRNSTSV